MFLRICFGELPSRYVVRLRSVADSHERQKAADAAVVFGSNQPPAPRQGRQGLRRDVAVKLHASPATLNGTPIV